VSDEEGRGYYLRTVSRAFVGFVLVVKHPTLFKPEGFAQLLKYGASPLLNELPVNGMAE
jgi:hypothetical protein